MQDTPRLDTTDKVANGATLTFAGTVLTEPAPSKIRSAHDILGDTFSLIDRRQRGLEKPIATPWADLNAQLRGGLWPGLHIITANTGAGKTALALQIGTHAVKDHTPVLYVGLELDAAQIGTRLIGNLCDLNWSDLYVGQSVDNVRLARAKNFMDEFLRDRPFYVSTTSQWAVNALYSDVAEVRRRHPELAAKGVLVVVDYAQLIQPSQDQRGLEKRERVSQDAYAMRNAARELGISVLAISSTSRAHYHAAKLITQAGFDVSGRLENPEMFLGMGKESGDLEYAADSETVLLRVGGNMRAMVTSKSRVGPAGWCALEFSGWGFTEGDRQECIEMIAADPNQETKGKK